MSLWRRLFAGCIPSHDLIRTRTATGVAIYQCQACGHEIPVLQTETVKGPAFAQADVPGKPITKVFRETTFAKRRVG